MLEMKRCQVPKQRVGRLDEHDGEVLRYNSSNQLPSPRRSRRFCVVLLASYAHETSFVEPRRKLESFIEIIIITI